jgi:signal transduction histidine kinase
MRRRFRDLPLFWKLLVPFLTLMVLVGAFGVFLIVRDLASRADVAVDQDLSRRSIDVRATLRDKELYLLESANFAANVEGMSAAVGARDASASGRLLESVLALKTDLELASATDQSGTSLVEYARASPGEKPSFGRGTDWSTHPFVAKALRDPDGSKASGIIDAGDRDVLAIIAPVCSASTRCAARGAALVGISIDGLVRSATGKTPGGQVPTGIAIYGPTYQLLARSGAAASDRTLPVDARSSEYQRTHGSGSSELATLYAPLEVQGERIGTLAVSVPTGPAFDSVRGAAVRLVLIVLFAMAGVVALGALLSRSIMAQVKPLVATNRALERGDLSARATVLGQDELGELARGVNQMAEQLEASVETLESRVEARTEEVRRLLRERTEFFASLSHEFRTPLAVILRQADLLLDPRTPKTSRWAHETGASLRDSGRQLLHLINEILELAKAEVGGLEVTFEKVRLDEVVSDARRTMEGLAKGAGISLSMRVPRTLPPVQADPMRLREIILNLVDNAVKYTPKGGRVSVSAIARNRHVEISVADTGVGIPSEANERIFEPFYRVKGIRTQQRQPATGLGLALTKKLVEAHGGEISFVSKPGSGSTFTFTLPSTRKRARRA